MSMDWNDEPDPSAGEEAYSSTESGIDEDGFDTYADDTFDDPEPSLDSSDTDDVDSASEDDPAAGDDGFTDETDGGPQSHDDTTPQDEPVAIDVVDEEVTGTDPDVTTYQDDPAFETEFPADLELDPRPEPIDGQPWSDAALLGPGTETDTMWSHTQASPDINELASFNSSSPDSGWAEMTTSGDPAVATLARWWQP